ncbi:MAG: outer membrane protein assembly factor BamD [Bacteroidales bacterium]|nr:outer membrane protein assembly factor BamD [Bacteroidales bacterium]
MMKNRILISLLFAVLLLPACKSQYELLLESNDTEAKYKAAFELYNNKKYNKAAQMFESLSMLTKGTERDDTVLYYWGASNYNNKDYYTAETNFEQLINNYPRSGFAEEGRFLRIDCLFRQTLRYELDQTPTNRALGEIADYLREFPQTRYLATCKKMVDDLTGRLDRKAYEAAKLYYSIEDYLAAHVALKNVLKDNADNRFREEILYYTAMSSYKYAFNSVQSKQHERYLVFVDDYLNFVGELPESGYRPELEVLYKRSQKALGKDVGVVAETSERQFAKERAALLKKATDDESLDFKAMARENEQMIQESKTKKKEKLWDRIKRETKEKRRAKIDEDVAAGIDINAKHGKK